MSRLKTKPPKLFRIIRNVGILLATVSGAILAAPVSLPIAITTAAGYLALGGTIAGAVAHLPNTDE